jgi:hypothetical protein
VKFASYAAPSWSGAALAHDLQSLHYQVMKQEQRIQHLTERMACLDDDIEKLHAMIGRMNGAPTLWPYKDETLRRV